MNGRPYAVGISISLLIGLAACATEEPEEETQAASAAQELDCESFGDDCRLPGSWGATFFGSGCPESTACHESGQCPGKTFCS